MDTLVLQLDESKGTFKVLVDGKMEDQGTYTTGISEGIMDPAHAVMSSAAVDAANAQALAMRCFNQMKRIGLHLTYTQEIMKGSSLSTLKIIKKPGISMKKDLIPIASAFFRWHLNCFDGISTCPADEMRKCSTGTAFRIKTSAIDCAPATWLTGDHPDEVLIQCEVHPHVLLADGSVRQMSRSEMPLF